MKAKSVILFDGVCNLCNTSVQWIIEHDPKGLFVFASLQSTYGQTFLEKEHLKMDSFDSIILIEGDHFYQKSTAALKIAQQLSAPYRFLSVFLLIPKFIRDPFYSFIANNRYRFFGKQESCWLPTPELNDRFLKDGD